MHFLEMPIVRAKGGFQTVHSFFILLFLLFVLQSYFVLPPSQPWLYLAKPPFSFLEWGVLSVSDGGKDILVTVSGEGLPINPPSLASQSYLGLCLWFWESGRRRARRWISSTQKNLLAHGNFQEFFPLQRFPGNLGNS